MASEIQSTGPRLQLSRIGFLPEHFQLLESPKFRFQPPAQIAQEFIRLREFYAGNLVALRHLDVYDPDSQYQAKITELVRALQLGDDDKKTQLQQWFAENYPNMDYADVIP
ncbi:MAG: hypothetical protein A3B68_07120 [Candidatus Melainabacteria bacterium RIFCSPHIGHO2_02_FULL_34_12]|nr:MAG: hypothetical protein A3B68_07120 [Candidatus Melainabacteria bacterium RIFCSPHIGHO2_02_FULL_34_12]